LSGCSLLSEPLGKRQKHGASDGPLAEDNQVTMQDCTGHAELVLVCEVARKLGVDSLRGAIGYESGEPCAMCSDAMFWP
jgi:tRNA(Arg) A34 adenosine deaminase TadA